MIDFCIFKFLLLPHQHMCCSGVCDHVSRAPPGAACSFRPAAGPCSLLMGLWAPRSPLDGTVGPLPPLLI